MYNVKHVHFNFPDVLKTKWCTSWPHIHQALATAMDETEKAYLSMENSATTVISPHDGENE